jgi:hypothetical protein
MSSMLKKMEISYHTLERVLNLPVGVMIAGVREGSDFKIAEFVLVDEYNKLPKDVTLNLKDGKQVTWEEMHNAKKH